jgi:MFS family permease
MATARGIASTTFRSLRTRNYRLFFIGQGVSVVGTWVQKIAMGWLVFRLTNDVFMLGLVAFCSQISQLFVPPLAGVLADRVNRRSIVLVTQTLATVQAFTLGVLALTGTIQVWHIVALALWQGLVSSFDITARQSFVADMIEVKEDFGNAIALNSSLFNIARIIGPTIGAGLIAGGSALAALLGLSARLPYAGEGICFIVNAVSFGAVIFALARMDVPRRQANPLPPRLVLANIREGFSYALRHPAIGSILLLTATVSLLATPFVEMLPVFAKNTLGGDERVYGYLASAMGVGAFAGAILLASRRRVDGLGKLMVMAVILLGVGLAVFSRSHKLALSLPLLVVVGFGMMLRGASANTLIQTLVDDDKRGRVISIYIMAQQGVAPFGNLLQGYLARHFGAANVVLATGLLCLLAAGWFATQVGGVHHQLRAQQRACPVLAALRDEAVAAAG